MGVVKIVLVILAALLSVIVTEALAFIWLANAPRSFDLVGQFYLLTVLPAALITVLVAALLAWKLFKQNQLRNTLIYAAVYIGAHALLMQQLGNPAEVLMMYALTLAFACAVVLLAFSRLVWSR